MHKNKQLRICDSIKSNFILAKWSPPDCTIKHLEWTIPVHTIMQHCDYQHGLTVMQYQSKACRKSSQTVGRGLEFSTIKFETSWDPIFKVLIFVLILKLTLFVHCSMFIGKIMSMSLTLSTLSSRVNSAFMQILFQLFAFIDTDN